MLSGPVGFVQNVAVCRHILGAGSVGATLPPSSRQRWEIAPRGVLHSDGALGLAADQIGQGLAQMLVVGSAKLVLDQNSVVYGIFASDICAECPDGDFGFDLRQISKAQSVCEYGPVLRLCKPK